MDNSAQSTELRCIFLHMQPNNLHALSCRPRSLGDTVLYIKISCVSQQLARGSEQFAKLCVRMGVDLSEVDLHMQTQSFHAASCGNLAMGRFLLNFRFEIDFQDEWRETALFYAIRQCHGYATSNPVLENPTNTSWQSDNSVARLPARGFAQRVQA